ncbi:MAG TPA: low affinity iron permease family protein [Chloroflexota bacterium]
MNGVESPNRGRRDSAFHQFAERIARATGHPLSFGVAVVVIAAWLTSGPLFGFSDTWQLVINTGTTIVTFLMVFLIQNTQSRESAAVQLKLDELIRATQGAHNGLLDLEGLKEGDQDRLREGYGDLARLAREDPGAGSAAVGTPEVDEPPSR